jgi:hypothetical protein
MDINPKLARFRLRLGPGGIGAVDVLIFASDDAQTAVGALLNVN